MSYECKEPNCFACKYISNLNTLFMGMAQKAINLRNENTGNFPQPIYNGNFYNNNNQVYDYHGYTFISNSINILENDIKKETQQNFDTMQNPQENNIKPQFQSFSPKKPKKNGKSDSSYQENIDVLICGICQQQFDSEKQLSKHFQVHIKKGKINCNYCKKLFNDSFDLKRHMRIHTQIRPFKCRFCQSKFTQRCSMEIHEKRVHGIDITYERGQRRPKVFVCEICGLTFNSDDKYKQHHNSFHLHITNLVSNENE